MESVTTRLIESFQAGDDSGKTYIIDCYQDFSKAEHFDDPSGIREGMKSLNCHLGPVDRIDDQTFRIIAINAVVKKL